MAVSSLPIAITAADAPKRAKASLLPEPFATRLLRREKRPLGNVFGLRDFGVNLTRLAPGAESALRHTHTLEDEFIYIISGTPTLHTDEGLTPLAPGMCAGFKAGNGNAHRLLNQTDEDVVYLEIGARKAGDEVIYPDDDIHYREVNGEGAFVRKDGSSFV